MTTAGAGTRAPEPVRAAAADFILEGLCALRKISRTDEGRMFATPSATRTRPQPDASLEALLDEEDDEPLKRRKKYYN